MSQYPPNNGQPPNWPPQQPSQYPPQQWNGQPQQPPSWQGQPNTGYQQPSGPQWQQQPGMYPPQQQYQQQMQPGGYPPQSPKKKSKRGLWITLGVIAVIVLALCIGVSALASNAAKSTQSSVDTSLTSVATDAATTAPSSQHFKVGQVVNVGSVDDVTVNSAKVDKGGAYNTPQKAGDVYLVFNVTLKNISQQEQSISSLIQFNVTDTTGQKYDVGFDTTAGASLDGKVEPGSLLRGSVVYEVPGSVKSFVLSFQTDLFTSGQTEWDIQV